jgi:methylglutaconyl-CoA hydratase
VTTARDPRPLVRAGRRGPVAVLTLDSPQNRNALSSPLLAELALALREVQADPDARAVVLTATGPVFCSGADLRERLGRLAAPTPTQARVGEDEDGRPPATLGEVVSLLAELPQPVVARVNGHVRAGGMGLVAACDLAVAVDTATFAFTEVRIGVAPAVVAVPALRVMGRRAFSRYALTGEEFSAVEAVAAGLLTASVAPANLDPWVAAAVSGVLRSSPAAVAATKDLLEGLDGRGWGESMATAATLSEELFATSAAAEGMAAFLEGRLPSWAEYEQG